jgi:cell division cycle 2-like protein
MHREAGIMHRDLKTSNLLYSNDGILKVCDFGLARKQTKRAVYTNWVVTLWYRAPELLLGESSYNDKIDIWSVGCILAELILGEPLLAGKNEMD